MKNRAKWIAFASTGLFSISQSLLFVMYPLLAEQMGLSISQVILCFTSGSCLFLWGSPYWSSRSDWQGRAVILQGGQLALFLSLMSVMTLMWKGPILGNTICFALLLISRIFYGLFASAMVPVAQALAVDGNSSATQAIAANSMILNLGRLIGPVAAAVLVGIAPLYWLAVPAVSLIPVIAITSGLKGFEAVSVKKAFRLHHIWPKEKKAQALFVFAFLTTGFLGILQSSLGGYLQAAYGLKAIDATHEMARMLIIGASATVMVQFFIRAKVQNPWQGSLPMGCLGLMLGCGLLLCSRGFPLLYCAVVLMSMGIGALTPSYSAAMSLLFSNEQGRAAGSLSVAHTLGYAAGGGLSAVGLAFGAQWPFILALILTFMLCVLLRPVYAGRKIQINFAA